MLQKIRCPVNETTKRSPYEVMFGRVPRIPLDLALGREKLDGLKQVITFEIGDKVLWEYDQQHLEQKDVSYQRSFCRKDMGHLKL